MINALTKAMTTAAFAAALSTAVTPSYADAFGSHPGTRGTSPCACLAPVSALDERFADPAVGQPCIPGALNGPINDSCSYRAYTPDDGLNPFAPF